jgi:predicted nucleotidyltransferase
MVLSQEVKSKIVTFLKNKLNIRFVYLFGSFAKGEGRKESDIDIAIYTTDIMDEYDLFILAGELSFKVKRDVQIISLKEASTVFAAQIVGTSELLYSDDTYFKDNYEIRVFKDYAKLNEERSVVLERIAKEGKIYGEGYHLK